MLHASLPLIDAEIFMPAPGGVNGALALPDAALVAHYDCTDWQTLHLRAGSAPVGLGMAVDLHWYEDNPSTINSPPSIGPQRFVVASGISTGRIGAWTVPVLRNFLSVIVRANAATGTDLGRLTLELSNLGLGLRSDWLATLAGAGSPGNLFGYYSGSLLNVYNLSIPANTTQFYEGLPFFGRAHLWADTGGQLTLRVVSLDQAGGVQQPIEGIDPAPQAAAPAAPPLAAQATSAGAAATLVAAPGAGSSIYIVSASLSVLTAGAAGQNGTIFVSGIGNNILSVGTAALQSVSDYFGPVGISMGDNNAVSVATTGGTVNANILYYIAPTAPATGGLVRFDFNLPPTRWGLNIINPTSVARAAMVTVMPELR
jgi:hypothetical protein